MTILSTNKQTLSRNWFGVDLDGTLAKYYGWNGPTVIGEPILPMVELVKRLLESGQEVRLVTARAKEAAKSPEIRAVIEAWCKEHLGQIIPITDEKDFGMIVLYDDRAEPVEHNTGRLWRSVLEQDCLNARLLLAEAAFLLTLDFSQKTEEIAAWYERYKRCFK